LIAVMPVVTPLTMPVPLPMVATEGLPLLHVPPAGLPVRLIVAEAHSAPGPVIVLLFTVTVFTAAQPVPLMV